jgi:hypothetical protein
MLTPTGSESVLALIGPTGSESVLALIGPTGSESALASARRSSEQMFEESTRSARSMRGAVGSGSSFCV